MHLTPKQTKDLARVREFMTMTTERFLELEIKIYSSFDHGDYVPQYIASLEANDYRDKNLEVFDAYASRSSMHVVKGEQKWKRKDGKPITALDLIAIQGLYEGQSNKFEGQVGDNHIVYKWLRDSSD